ncbi:hypothetical protein BM613_03710 [Sulfoacidibacillus thermotolerans]|uniref:Tellurium resistance protein TerC n=1 Tax=Sulfoacidibacillus thermotolerans TaxID=1765684 RepID=A0A2U3DAM7_SULT2|nr:hypothetical protein BM613_03710 [Sulfoacidibacillus thermotolerans]
MWMGILAKVIEILLVNLVLSGDNALVIGVTTLRLSAHQRRLAVLFGTAISIVLRIWLTLFAGGLMTLPYLQVVGGIFLCFIAWSLLRAEQQVESAQEAVKSRPKTLLGAIFAIVFADIMMSIDNVVALAGIAAGNEGVLILGLIISIALIMFASTILTKLIARYRFFLYAGALMIVWVAGGMMAKDPMAAHLPHLLLPFTALFLTSFLYGVQRIFRASE